MSRSYKHTPYSGQKKNKFMKNYFNRRIRRNRNLYLPYNSYRKYGCSYDICDYYNIVSKNFNEYYKYRINQWQKWKSFIYENYPTKEECWKEYQKWYVRK